MILVYYSLRLKQEKTYTLLVGFFILVQSTTLGYLSFCTLLLNYLLSYCFFFQCMLESFCLLCQTTNCIFSM